MKQRSVYSSKGKYILPLIWVFSLGIGVIYFANRVLNLSTEYRSAAFNDAGASFFVDKYNVGGNSCNDAWSGSITQPFCTIAKGLSVFNPGDNLYLRAGSYPSFSFNRSGSNNLYFNISSYNNEKVIIQGGSDTVRLNGVSYVRIHGLEITGATGSYGAGLRVTNSGSFLPNYNILENNLVHDNLGSNTYGIVVEDGSFNRILNNRAYNNYLSGIQITSHSSVTPGGVTGNEISGNYSYNNVAGAGNSDGIKLEGSGTKNTLVSNNVMYGNSDDGLDTWNTSYNTVTNNLAYNQVGPGDGDGFKVGGGVTGGHNLVKQNIAYGNKLNGFDSNGTGNDTFINNVAYNNTNFGFEDGWKDSPCTPSTCVQTFINNIGYNNVRGNFSASEYTGVSHNNLWYSDSGSPKVLYKYTTHANLASFYAGSGNRLDNPSAGQLSSLSLDPKFTSLPLFDFSLLSGSPAVDHGDPANPGQITTVGTPDIGAKESLVSSPTSSPAPSLTPTPTPTPSPSPTASPITSDLVAPQVFITSPANNSSFLRGSTIPVVATSSDNVAVAKLDIYVNGSFICTTSTPSITCNWKTGKAKARTNLVKATATDRAGNMASTSIFVITK